MRISDWSSDVCSSDLCADELFIDTAAPAAEGHILVQPFAPITADQEGYQVIQAFLEGEGSPLEDEGLHYAQAWYTMHVMYEGIKAALSSDERRSGQEGVRTSELRWLPIH